MKRLIIFTNAFPYGNGYNWIMEELHCFSVSFDEVLIVPFSYEGNRKPVRIPGKIKVMKPLELNDVEYKSPWQILQLSLSRIHFYLREFVREKVFTNSYWFKSWLKSCLLADQLIQSTNFRFLRDLVNKSETTLYFYWGNNQSLLIPFLKKLNFRKIFVRFHGFDLYKERLGGYQAFRRPILEHLDVALPISAFGREYLHQNWPDLKFQSIISRLGTTHRGLSPQNDGISFHIVSCARLIKLKRIEMIPKALQNIQTRRIEWTHIGDGEELDNIQRLCQGLPANISVDLMGWVPAEDISELYSHKSFDLFVSVSESEGIPVSIMEALSAGIPVLSTDVGGISELLDEQNGYLISKDINEQALTNKIQQIITDNDLGTLSKKKQQAFRTFRDKCDAKKLAKELNTLLSA